MPAGRNGQAVKEAVLEVITENIGSKTAEMYRGFYDVHTPEVAINSAEELLREFVGRQRANELIQSLRVKFKLSPTKIV